MSNTKFGIIRRLFSSIRTIWLIAGICLLALVGVEGAIRLIWLAKDRFVDASQSDRHVFVDKSSEYQPKAWEAEYEQEYAAQSAEWHSYVYWRRRPFRGKLINVDAQGVRRTWSDSDSADQAQGRRKRIFAFGGSTMWGTGSRDEYTIPSHLAKELAEAGVPADVVNFGESGFVSGQELIALILQLRQGNIPDAVIFYDGANDAYSAYQNGSAGYPQNEYNRVAEFNLLRDRGRFNRQIVRTLPEDFWGLGRLADAARRRLSGTTENSAEPSLSVTNRPELATQVVRLYSGNLRLLQALSTSYKFEAWFYWQPLVFTKRSKTKFETEWADTTPWIGMCKAVYDEVDRSEELRQTNSFRNISDVFNDVSGAVYLDSAHVNEDANARIAHRIAQDVIQEFKTSHSPDFNDNLSH